MDFVAVADFLVNVSPNADIMVVRHVELVQAGNELRALDHGDCSRVVELRFVPWTTVLFTISSEENLSVGT